MLRKSRNIPSGIARQLRKEANFGCSKCGHPVLQYAHITPYRKTKEFKAEDMLAVCPNCHDMLDKGNYPEQFFRRLKARPHNKSYRRQSFSILNKDMVVHIGGVKCTNTPRVLVYNKTDLISVKKCEDGDVLLNVNFYNERNELIAQVKDNSWIVYTKSIWDLVYKSRKLTIWNKPKKISCEIKIKYEEIFIRGNLYYEGFLIKISPNEIKVGNTPIRGSLSITNGQIGIDCSIR